MRPRHAGQARLCAAQAAQRHRAGGQYRQRAVFPHLYRRVHLFVAAADLGGHFVFCAHAGFFAGYATGGV